MAILFHDEQVKSGISNKKEIKGWITDVISEEGKKSGDINIILTSDENLRKINLEHLSRDYYTDIITFDYSEDEVISGDLFISVDRVNENAGIFGVNTDREMLRVIVHGILHLAGYTDSNELDVVVMREKEDYYLEYFKDKN